MKKFTPGPWGVLVWDADRPNSLTITDFDDHLLSMDISANPEQGRANADLIAAAPDMFAALELALMTLNDVYSREMKAGVHSFYDPRIEVAAAIKKAQGK